MFSRTLRRLSSAVNSEFKCLIVGSGPSSHYLLKSLLLSPLGSSSSSIFDVIDKSCCPGGLIRYGVAPDHQDVKNLQSDIDAFLGPKESTKAAVRYLGNVEVGGVGEDGCVSLPEIKAMYDAVVLATGCQHYNEISVPTCGPEGLSSEPNGLIYAKQLVDYYNGLPGIENPLAFLVPPSSSGSGGDSSNSLDVSSKDDTFNVTIVGGGNVAVDIARVIIMSAAQRDQLCQSDITTDAYESLGSIFEGKRVNVRIVSRRGLHQSSFTIKEIRALTKICKAGGLSASVWAEEMEKSITDAGLEEVKDRRLKRLTDFVASLQSPPAGDDDYGLSLRYLLRPEAIRLNDQGNVESVKFRRQTLVGEKGQQKGVDTDATLEMVRTLSIRGGVSIVFIAIL